MVPGSAYFVEVVSGAHEGERFEVDIATSSAAGLAYEGAVPPADASIVVRAHWTLGELFPVASFHAGTSPSNADRVMLFDGTGYRVIWLLATKSGARWVAEGDVALKDVGGTVIGPADGVMVHPRAAPVTRALLGQVRSWKFAVPLHAGAQLVGAGYPVALSPADRGMTASNGFVAGTSANGADSVRIWVGDSTPGATGYSTFSYVQANDLGSFWADGAGTDATTAKLFGNFRATYLISTDSKPDWIQIVPWKP